jgi:peptidylprolyl isomerase
MSAKPVLAPGSGTAPTGLVVRDLVVGSGATVSTTATVNLKYVGALYSDATVFDASWGSSGATGPDQASFPLSGVIPGFAQGLVGMKVGGRREIVIPAALGYGSNATGKIPANSTIVFVVDMMKTTG